MIWMKKNIKGVKNYFSICFIISLTGLFLTPSSSIVFNLFSISSFEPSKVIAYLIKKISLGFSVDFSLLCHWHLGLFPLKLNKRNSLFLHFWNFWIYKNCKFGCDRMNSPNYFLNETLKLTVEILSLIKSWNASDHDWLLDGIKLVRIKFLLIFQVLKIFKKYIVV